MLLGRFHRLWRPTLWGRLAPPVPLPPLRCELMLRLLLTVLSYSAIHKAAQALILARTASSEAECGLFTLVAAIVAREQPAVILVVLLLLLIRTEIKAIVLIVVVVLIVITTAVGRGVRRGAARLAACRRRRRAAARRCRRLAVLAVAIARTRLLLPVLCGRVLVLCAAAAAVIAADDESGDRPRRRHERVHKGLWRRAARFELLKRLKVRLRAGDLLTLLLDRLRRPPHLMLLPPANVAQIGLSQVRAQLAEEVAKFGLVERLVVVGVIGAQDGLRAVDVRGRHTKLRERRTKLVRVDRVVIVEVEAREELVDLLLARREGHTTPSRIREDHAVGRLERAAAATTMRAERPRQRRQSGGGARLLLLSLGDALVVQPLHRLGQLVRLELFGLVRRRRLVGRPRADLRMSGALRLLALRRVHLVPLLLAHRLVVQTLSVELPAALAAEHHPLLAVQHHTGGLARAHRRRKRPFAAC